MKKTKRLFLLRETNSKKCEIQTSALHSNDFALYFKVATEKKQGKKLKFGILF